MSKEIKFRAWDKVEGHYWNDLLNIGTGGRPEFDCADEYFECDEFIIEQCTGLKDKNGKEIYEGDIVNLEYYEKPFGKKRWIKTYPLKGGRDINIVGFEDGYFKFYEEDKDGYGSELAFSDYGEWEDKDMAYKYVAEVIGNIHENPELLGDEE